MRPVCISLQSTWRPSIDKARSGKLEVGQRKNVGDKAERRVQHQIDVDDVYCSVVARFLHNAIMFAGESQFERSEQ